MLPMRFTHPVRPTVAGLCGTMILKDHSTERAAAMSKGMNRKKETRKKAAKTPAEKRAAKREKKSAR
jgi:hypothetical protein